MDVFKLLLYRFLLMSCRFLADADWGVVEKYTDIQDAYQTTEEEAQLDNLTNFQRTSPCPKCRTQVPNEPSKKEWMEMRNEARLRLLKAEKVSTYVVARVIRGKSTRGSSKRFAVIVMSNRHSVHKIKRNVDSVVDVRVVVTLDQLLEAVRARHAVT